MHKYILLLFSVLLLTGCSPPPKASEIGRKYSDYPDKYLQLKEMIIEDTRDTTCFAVGIDHIGEYWESSGEWSHSKDYQTKLDLNGVLSDVGIARTRYEEYLILFRDVGAERIEYCSNTAHWGRWVRVLNYRSGLAVSGCGGTIEWFEKNPPVSEGVRGEGNFVEVFLLENGWQSMVVCT
jgi:hypothetical protein